jgi:energy-converting hydrogenase Eha subunit E
MSRDLRKYARNTNIRLLVGFILLLFTVGGSLIYMIYGANGALFAVICLLAGLAPLLLIALILWGMEWVVKRINED